MTDTKPGEINDKTGFRVASREEVDAAHKKVARTGSETHRATARGYAVPDNADGAGVLIEDGEIVPANVPVGEWMEKISKKDAKLLAAGEEALDPHPKDVDLTKLNVAALQAMAAERGINVEQAGTPLSKKELITAISAARENDAG
jgi:hypothetical protein